MRCRCLDLFRSTLERDDGPSLGEFGLEFGDDEVSGKEGDAESDRDTEVLGIRTLERGYGRYKAVSYPPHVSPFVVEAELEISKTIDRCLSRNGANDRANLVIERDILIARTLRNEVRTL